MTKPPPVRRRGNLFGEVITPQTRKRYAAGLGCEFCPMNGVPGVNKVKGLTLIKRRKAMLWAQNPGKTENAKHLALVGPSGQLLWEDCRPLGLTREDFDIQNVVRCLCVDAHGMAHNPTKRELQCCSVYNDEALRLNAESAVVHLVLGEVAGKQLLGKDYRKDRPMVWYAPWNAYVVFNYHPSFILRTGRQGHHYFAFKDRLKAVKSILKHPGRWGYVLAQDYGAVTTPAEMQKLEAEVYAEARAGRRISLDIEDGVVNGNRVVLMIGIGIGCYEGKGFAHWKGKSRSVILYHPEADQNTNRLTPLLCSLRRIIEDKNVKKSLQHGNYDAEQLLSLLGWKLQGYDFDTQYAGFLYKSHHRSYSLENMINMYLIEFADYKTTMVAEWLNNLAEAPLERLVPYNGADCDVTKRLECRFAPHINQELLNIYVHVASVLDAMEDRGPILDRRVHDELLARINPQLEYIRRALNNVADKEDFNPRSPDQVQWLLFDKLGLPATEGRSTEAEPLDALFKKTKHPAIQLVLEHRALSVVENTFLGGWLLSADLHDGHLATTWWLTGAATNRLRSGRGKEVGKDGIVNFQNFTGNRIVQQCLVSDKNWRLALLE